MKKIIALRGMRGSGKTTTLKKLPAMLLQQGYSQEMFSDHGKDFMAIYVKDGIKIGITSAGDVFKLLKDRLNILIKNNGCDICICACRSYDKKPPGTIAATQSFSTHPPQYLEKTVIRNDSETEQEDANQTDAKRLFNLI